MNIPGTTPIPNIYFDVLKRELNLGELQVLETIMRKTYGFTEHLYTTRRKKKASISVKYFVRRGGISNATVTKAIANLIDMKLIRVTDSEGQLLHDSKLRAKASKLFFEPLIGVHLFA